jgi:homoserine dehydrogenase
VFDGEVKKPKIAAENSGPVFRYIGSVQPGTKTVKVALEEVDLSRPIAPLKCGDNITSFHTKRSGRLPLIVQGAGAGRSDGHGCAG